jgi:hypothetical protein
MFLWVLASTAFAVIPFTEYFIPASSTSFNRVYGVGYYLYIWGLVAVYAVIFKNTYDDIKRLVGVARLELQVWLGGGCALAGAVYLLMALSALTGDSTYRKMQPVAMLVFYVSTAFVITYSRIFDARQILKALGELSIIVGIICAAAIGVYRFGYSLIGDPWALILTVVTCLWIRRSLARHVGKWLHHYPGEDLVRAELMAASRRQSKADGLEHSFASVLRGWWQTEDVLLAVGSRDGFRLENISREEEAALTDELRDSGWVTPERLSRERESRAKLSVRAFLARNRLSILVSSKVPR